MPNTGQRREITKRVNAKEAEIVQQSKKLLSRTREITADADGEELGACCRNQQTGIFSQSVTQPARDGNSKKKNPSDESCSSARLR